VNILLVEDMRSVAALMSFRLSELGHDVTVAQNGAEAVEHFKELAPDLVLMDIEMPVMNGFEATTRIRSVEACRKWAWTPIIFLTASEAQTDLVTAIEAGGDDFLPKSVSEPVLQAKIKAMSRIAQLRSALAVANAKLEELATRDSLTGMFNRRYMNIQVDALWELDRTADQGMGALGVLMIDVDHFKLYNDTYGHQAGDECLICVADAIAVTVAGFEHESSIARSFSARYGGEEFAVVIPVTSQGEMQRFADNLLEAVRSLKIPHVGNPAHGIVTVSIGGMHGNPKLCTAAQVFRQADAALYRSKEQGRNQANFGPA
jgi:diguanylate cyclase (GGDEF)-like protein